MAAFDRPFRGRSTEKFGTKPNGEIVPLLNACGALPPKAPRSWTGIYTVLLEIRATVLKAMTEVGVAKDPKDWRTLFVCADRLEELGLCDAALAMRDHAAARGYRLMREKKDTLSPTEHRHVLNVYNIRQRASGRLHAPTLTEANKKRASQKRFWVAIRRGKAQLELAKLTLVETQAIATKNMRVRRQHSRSGRVRCDICSPNRCQLARDGE